MFGFGFERGCWFVGLVCSCGFGWISTWVVIGLVIVGFGMWFSALGFLGICGCCGVDII